MNDKHTWSGRYDIGSKDGASPQALDVAAKVELIVEEAQNHPCSFAALVPDFDHYETVEMCAGEDGVSAASWLANMKLSEADATCLALILQSLMHDIYFLHEEVERLSSKSGLPAFEE